MPIRISLGRVTPDATRDSGCCLRQSLSAKCPRGAQLHCVLGPLVALLCACGPASGSPEGEPDSDASRSFESTRVTACDITNPPCQMALFEHVASLQRFAGASVQPEVRFLSPGQAVEFVGEELVGCQHGAAAELNSARAEALTQLGLKRPDKADDSRASLALGVKALYLQERGEVIIIDRGEPKDMPVANYVLAHEFVHAIQDQNVGLQAYMDGHGHCFDARLSAVAAVEGEAVRVESIIREALFGRAMTDEQIVKEAAERIAKVNRHLLDEPFVYDTAFSHFPYSYGTRWAASLGTPAAYGEALASAPTRTAQYLFDVVRSPAAPSFPPNQGEVVASDRLGAWLLFGLVAGWLPDAREPHQFLEQLAHYRDDQLFVLAEDPSPQRASWTLDWTDEAHARWFSSLATQGLSATLARVERRSRTVVVNFSVLDSTSGDSTWSLAYGR